MPINVAMLVGIVALVLGIAVWSRTRRVGPVAGVVLAAFLIMAVTDASTLKSGGEAVSSAITWAVDTLLTF